MTRAPPWGGKPELQTVQRDEHHFGDLAAVRWSRLGGEIIYKFPLQLFIEQFLPVFTQGLLNIMLLSNLKDRIVRGHPGNVRIPGHTEPSTSTSSVKNAIKGAAAQSVFSPFCFFFSSFLCFFFCFPFVFGICCLWPNTVRGTVCMCVRRHSCVRGQEVME